MKGIVIVLYVRVRYIVMSSVACRAYVSDVSPAARSLGLFVMRMRADCKQCKECKQTINVTPEAGSCKQVALKYNRHALRGPGPGVA
jgi:hypothetical protein